MNIKEYNSFHNSLEKIAKQHLQITDIIAKNSITNQQLQFINNIRAITPNLSSIINNSTYKQLYIKTSYLAEKLNKNFSPLLINITSSTYDKLLKCDFSTLKSLQDNISNINISDLSVFDFTNTGNVIYENETYTSDEINNSISDFILKVSTGTMDYSDVKKYPKLSISFLIIMYIILTLIIPDIYSSAKQYIKENYFSNKSEVSANDYHNFQIITTDNLNVRRHPSTDSDIIGHLYYLNVVKVIDSCPYWLKIEYTDTSNNIQITGWISKKYTTDFSHETEKLFKSTNK